MVFINASNVIGVTVAAVSDKVAGSEFMAYFIILAALLVVLLMFRVPIVYAVVFMIPLLITLMAFNGLWYGVGGVVLILIAVIVLRQYIFS